MNDWTDYCNGLTEPYQEYYSTSEYRDEYFGLPDYAEWCETWA